MEKQIENLKQKRAVETRQKLLEKAVELYEEKGYYVTTVDEIARSAGLSTGIAYRYFKDKKDLMFYAIQQKYISIREYIFREENFTDGIDNMNDFLSHLLDIRASIYKKYYKFNAEFECLRNSDVDVKRMFNDIESNYLESFINKLPEQIATEKNIRERLICAYEIINYYTRIVIEDNPAKLDFEFLKNKTITSILQILDFKPDASIHSLGYPWTRNP